MFGNGRARSGIVVLPCGAGKTLVGVAAASRVHKGTLVLCNSTIGVMQWCDQFCRWTVLGATKESGMRVVPFTAGSKETLPEGACVLVTTYAMMAKSKGRSEEGGSIMEEIYGRHWGLLLMDEVRWRPFLYCSGSHVLVLVCGFLKCSGSYGWPS